MNTRNVNIIGSTCCGCGTCQAVCPSQCVDLRMGRTGFFIPHVRTSDCTQCGLCLKVCPSYLYPRETPSRDSTEEQYFCGFSLDPELRRRSSSGGLVTEMLLYLLRKGLVNNVVVVGAVEGNLKPQVMITNDPETITNCKGSKYAPVAVNTFLQKLESVSGNVAVMALPCQALGLRLAQETIPALSGKISFILTLFCSGTPSLNATKYIIENCQAREVNRFRYRGGGWPGHMAIHSKDTTWYLPYRRAASSGFSKYFKNCRCEMCDDPFGVCGDASFADPYFMNAPEIGDGQTFAVVRNETLRTALKEMQEERQIELREIRYTEEVRKAYASLHYRHDSSAFLMMQANALMKRGCPDEVKLRIKSMSLINRTRLLKVAFSTSLRRFLGRRKWLWRFLFFKNFKGRIEKKQVNK